MLPGRSTFSRLDLPAQADVLSLSHDNAIVRSHVNLWLNGMVTWEQAMMSVVMDLTSALERAEQVALDIANGIAVIPQSNTRCQ